MKKERRWMTSVLKEAAKSKIDMPWARGTRRETLVIKRTLDRTSQTARA